MSYQIHSLNRFSYLTSYYVISNLFSYRWFDSVWKVVNIGDAGTSIKFGADDTDKINKLFAANDVDDIDINADWTFRSGKLNIRNPANTFSYNIVAAAISAARTLNLPLITATDTLASLGLAQTFTAAKTFNTSTLKLRNPADPFSYTVVPAAIAADRNLNLPLTTASDTLATLGLAQTFTATQIFNGSVELQKDLKYTSDISPSQITSDQNDYNPTNLDISTRVRLDADSSFRTITGLATGADGRMLILTNISANTILLANQNTSSSAANRFDFGGIDVPLFPGAQIKLIYDSTSTKWRSASPQFIIPSARQGVYNSVHYFGDATAEGGIFTEVAASGGTAAAITSLAAHPGILELSFGTSATGSATSKIGNASILLGNSWYWKFEAVVKLVALSSADPDYTVRIGFIDNGAAESTDGAFFRYNDNVNSGKWQKVTRNNGTETGSANDTTVTADTNFHRYTIIVNPAGTVAEFFVDGVSKGTETTNIPTGAGRVTGGGVMFLKTAGVTDTAAIDIDSQEIIGYANVTN